MLTARKKVAVIKDIRRHDSDTGSTEVQVALLTKQIEVLTKHLKTNAKDFHSRRGLLKMVSDRRKHLKYLERKDSASYAKLIKELGLKK
ncbi:30S ribosomal protein S15 [Candidatus Kaiserbacteria bacterium RIFCSPHIGHO2_02_FULL_49_34]|uniref:Small ribosomal subunit protein uS15 n=1 Tax=Candidatus Kaiserbacteria bacterium RIFCSPHIGHO2_02_FULL_49_34 TaxID=1798491 RepID=A0A1F6DKH8_9BACT|nr:MAG: 30S ribosomal protein S15 [Candidatus Kaiserbacteria bacterium RIFCSPHIGHO2_02_FULL_49_34]